MRLLRLDHIAVQKLFDDMEKDVDTIKRGALQLTWYMRGGVSYTDVLNMSSSEREAISDLAEKNLETTKNTQLPFF
mgnify:CR=1 FL=1